MKDTKLYRFYSTFSVEEAKEWLVFVQSPYFNTNPNVIKMATILRSYHPEMAHKGLTKQKVYKRIFGKEEYQDIKMRKLMSACVKLIERYWVGKEVESNDLVYRRQLTHGYRHRDLFVDYQKEMNALIKDHEERAKVNPESFYDLYQLNWDLTADRQFLKGIETHGQLKRASDHMYRYNQYLYLLHYIIWHDASQSVTFPIPPYLSNRPYIDRSTSLTASENILLYTEDAITSEKIKYDLFDKASQYLKDYYLSIDENIRYYCYRLLLNYLMCQRRKGIKIEDRYIPLMQEAVQRNAFIYRGKMSIAIFINLSAELSAQNFFEEASNFIEKSVRFLSGGQIEEIEKIARCHILFYSKAYFDTYILTSSFYFTGKPELEIVRRTLQVRSALSSNKIDAETTYAITGAFEKYLRRNRTISAGKKSIFLKLISLVNRVQAAKNNSTDSGKTKDNLIRDIKRSTYDQITIAWLLKETE